MAVSTSTQKTQDLKIHDPSGTFFAYVWTLIFVVIPIMVFVNGGFVNGLLASLFLFPVAYFFFLTAKAKTEGTTLSVENQSITYPGGSIAAESIVSYFTPSFWLQSTKTHTTKFEDITQLNWTFDTTIFNKFQKMTENKKYVAPKYRYGVGIQGIFGSATIYFRNEQKADQLYGVLRQYLKAGVPVVDARS